MSNIDMLNYHRRKRFINAIVSDVGMAFEEDSGCHRGRVVGKKITMPPYPVGATIEEDTEYFAELLRCCYESLPEAVADQAKRPVETSGVDQIYDYVTTFNTTHKRAGEYLGADEYIRRANDTKIASAIRAIDSMEPQAQALIAFDALMKGEVKLADEGLAESLANSLTGEAKQYLDKLLDKCSAEYLEEKAGGKSLPLANKIARILNTQESKQQQGDGDGKGKSGEEQEGQEGGKGKGDGDSGGEEEREGEGKEAGEAQSQTAKPFGVGKGFKASEIGINKRFIFDYTNKNKFSALKIEEKTCEGKRVGRQGRHIHVMEELLNNDMSTKVRNLLKIYSQAKYEGGKKRGKINKRAIATVTRNNDKIFRKRDGGKHVLDTAVTLLVDSSGSMSGSKYTHAVASSELLVRCLQKLNIPVSVMGFTTNYNDAHGHVCLVYNHKRFNERVQDGVVVNRMVSEEVDLCGNADAEAVLHAYDLLSHQKQKRKILIVMSDGQPADGGYNGLDPSAALKAVVNGIEHTPGVEIYGVGILTESVNKYYTNRVVINNTSQLESSLLQLLKNAIIN